MILFFIVLSVGASTSMAQYLRPCALDDYACIRYVLSQNSDCTTGVWGAAPAQVTRLDSRYEVPYVNASYVSQYSTTRNINNCKVSAFFFNRTANVGVMSIDCPDLVIEANRELIQHYPRAEDKYYSAKIVTHLPLISFTTNFIPASYINLCDSFTFAYITGLPKIKLYPNGPGAAQFLEIDVNGQESHVYVYLREDFLHRAAFIFRLYINSVICDFGCN